MCAGKKNKELRQTMDVQASCYITVFTGHAFFIVGGLINSKWEEPAQNF